MDNYLKYLNQITSIEKIKKLTKNSPQYICLNKKDKLYKSYNEFINDNIEYKKKKIIHIGDGGLNGFYILGICAYIKENYKLDDMIYSGVSAGSWNSIIMNYKYDVSDIIFTLMNDLKKINTQTHSIYDLQIKLKKLLLNKYSDNDFIMDKSFHAVTCYKYKENSIDTILYGQFLNLEDMIDSAMASSHIPLITGGYINNYKNRISFDGGLSYTPYLKKKSHFDIKALLWNNNSIVNAFNQNNIDYMNLFMNGYSDTERNKNKLDKYFEKL
tara:strand:- start:2428 stop:3240 length:813 start_codon:yes stop_codon:yes gene_type:complete